jgi:hypothetical protein
MRNLLVATVLLLTACSPRPGAPDPESYQRIRDRMIVRFHLEPLAGYPCSYPTKVEGITVMATLDDDQCYRFNPPERIDGIWINEFENSALLTPTQFAKFNTPEGTIDGWLDIRTALPSRLRDSHGRYDGNFHIVFIGRRSAYPGHFGHMGMAPNLVLVDKLISIERLPESKPTESPAPQ